MAATGRAYPRARFFWRLETDVLFSGHHHTLTAYPHQLNPPPHPHPHPAHPHPPSTLMTHPPPRSPTASPYVAEALTLTLAEGRPSMLLNLTDDDEADLLLHKYQSESKDMQPRGADGRPKQPQDFFPHWATHSNETLLRGVPANRYRARRLANIVSTRGAFCNPFCHAIAYKPTCTVSCTRPPPPRRVRALVSVGRYSRRFLELLWRWYWSTGVVGFEEILLPVACAAAAANPRRSVGRTRPLACRDTLADTFLVPDSPSTPLLLPRFRCACVCPIANTPDAQVWAVHHGCSQ